MECSVCTKLLKDSKKTISCFHCNYVCCSSCCQTYLLSTVSNPHCMNCKHPWSEAFMSFNLSSSWLETKYKLHQKERLLDVEKSFLQESMAFVPAYKEYLSASQKYECFLTGAKSTMDHLQFTLSSYQTEYKKRGSNRKLLNSKIEECRKKLQQCKQTCNQFRFQVQVAYNHFITIAQETPMFTHQKYHHPCSIPSCRGFLDETWTCGLCQTRICKECRCIETSSHVCDLSIKASIDSILAQSRQCPKCHEAISRISGCDHMWCTLCNTGFSYKTGMLLANERNTNPHFTQWWNNQYASPSGPASKLASAIEQGMPEVYIRFLRCMQTLLETLLPSSNQYETFHPMLNRIARVRFLANEISEKEMMVIAYKHYKRWNFTKQIQQLLETVKNQLLNWFDELPCTLPKSPFMDPHLQKPHVIFHTFNQESRLMAKSFQYSVSDVFIGTHAFHLDTLQEGRPEWKDHFTYSYELQQMNV